MIRDVKTALAVRKDTKPNETKSSYFGYLLARLMLDNTPKQVPKDQKFKQKLNLKKGLTSAESDSGFGLLPVELKTKIFGFLNFAEKKNSRLVCPHWRTILNYGMKFKCELSNQTEWWIQNSELMALRDVTLESLILHNLTNNVSMPSFKIIPPAQHYIIGRGNSGPNVVNFLRYFSSEIGNLTIHNLSLAKVNSQNLFRVLPYIEWSCLSTLAVTLGSHGVTMRYAEDYANHIDAVIPVLKSIRFKTLRNFTVNLNYSDSPTVVSKRVYFKKPWIEILGFILKHKRSLRELTMIMSGAPAPPKPSLYADLISPLEGLALLKFSIEFDGLHSHFANALCCGLKPLRKLEIRQKFWTKEQTGQPPHEGQDFEIDEILRLEAKKLKSLCCHCVSFESLWLQHLPVLKFLTLKTSDLKFIASTPVIPTLEKFFLLNTNTFDAHLAQNLIECVVNRMPNIQELELILMARFYTFETSHVEILQSLPKLKKISLGKFVNMEIFEKFCKSNAMLELRRETRQAIPEVTRRFECAIIEITRPFQRPWTC